MEEELVDEEDGETSSGSPKDGVDDGQTNYVSITWVGYRALRASIESQEAEYENESPKPRERNGMSWNIIRLALLRKPQGSGSDDVTSWREK